MNVYRNRLKIKIFVTCVMNTPTITVAVIDTTIGRCNSFFMPEKRLGTKVFEVQRVHFVFRHLPGKEKRPFSRQNHRGNPSAIVETILSFHRIIKKKPETAGSVHGFGHICFYSISLISVPFLKVKTRLSFS